MYRRKKGSRGCSWAEVAQRSEFQFNPVPLMSISASVWELKRVLPTSAALSCFSFQNSEHWTACSDPASLDELTDRKHMEEEEEGGVDMGRKHVFYLWEDKSKWWTGQHWKIGSPIWGLSKGWLIYLAGSDGREASPFPCFHLRQAGQSWGQLEGDSVCFSCSSVSRAWSCKREKDGWGKKRTEWEVKKKRKRSRERMREEKWDGQGGKKWAKAGREHEGRRRRNKKQIGSPLISSPATHTTPQSNAPPKDMN